MRGLLESAEPNAQFLGSKEISQRRWKDSGQKCAELLIRGEILRKSSKFQRLCRHVMCECLWYGSSWWRGVRGCGTRIRHPQPSEAALQASGEATVLEWRLWPQEQVTVITQTDVTWTQQASLPRAWVWGTWRVSSPVQASLRLKESLTAFLWRSSARDGSAHIIWSQFWQRASRQSLILFTTETASAETQGWVWDQGEHSVPGSDISDASQQAAAASGQGPGGFGCREPRIQQVVT